MDYEIMIQYCTEESSQARLGNERENWYIESCMEHISRGKMKDFFWKNDLSKTD